VSGAWRRLAELPVRVEGYALEGLELKVGSDFTRLSTVVRLHGAGHDGVGEDVTYDGLDHVALQDAGPALPLAGEWTLETFSRHLDEVEVWPSPPITEASRPYRRWAFESAALDLALRQAGTSLAERLGREPRPVTFVLSLRLGEPPTLEPVRRRLAHDAGLRFKLDATSSWDEALVAELRATGAVDSVDLKGLYEGTIVDQGADAGLYRRVAEGLPDAWIEDPRLTPETDAILEPHRDRITWDANIHAVADIEGLPFPPRMVNVKPSRFGTLEALLATYDFCEERGTGMYGGGQFELGPGRGQIQALASLFHPDGPNDVAPAAYHVPDPPPGLPASPLSPDLAPLGFRWGGDGR
jgi:L-alanine-DL-glutamate epimerase-like enolase superfamily enzyme